MLRTWLRVARWAALFILSGPTVAAADCVPPGAEGPGFPLHLTGMLHVEEIGQDTYWVTDGVYQNMFLVHQLGVILVDAPPSLMHTAGGDGLLARIAEVTSAPIKYLIYTHAHSDHIGGAGEVVAAHPGVTIVAHEDAARVLSQARTGVLSELVPNTTPLPTRTFEDAMTVRVGGQAVELEHRLQFHGDGDTFVYARRQKILLVADVVFPGWAPFSRLSLTAHVRGFFDAHDEILTYDFDTFIGGHVTRPGNRQDVEQARAYLFDLLSAAQYAFATVPFGWGLTPEQLCDPFNAFAAYLDAQADVCEAMVVPQWVDVLGGVASFTRSNCAVVLDFLRDGP